jgi:cytochrome b561
MKITNSEHAWGLISILLHWLCALVVIGLFVSGLWMVGLDYYSSKWYKIAPHWHKSVGVLLVAVMGLRLLWRFYAGRPGDIKEHKRWERFLSHLTHFLLYTLVLSMFLSGYLIVTADGRSLEVFNWFTVPSIWERDDLEDIAGYIHLWVAYSIILLAVLHALAAIKHHVIDKDVTLIRMLGRTKRH